MSHGIPQQDESSTHGDTLKVDFSWKKFKSLITDRDDPKSTPLYIVDYKATKPHLIFKTTADDVTFGTGTLHPVSINADCDFRGQQIKIEALKRFQTSYTHLSHAYSDTDEPVPMTWTSASGFKTWDFICLDAQQLPVAKFSANIWTLHKVGNIEFLGPKAGNVEWREELIVAGLTLFYCMVLRTSSLLSFFGAIFSNPAKQKGSSSRGEEEGSHELRSQTKKDV